jgi:hypothetical protein
MEYHQKAVRIMCDWCADGVWSVPGYPPESFADFRVSPELWARIQAWQNWYHQQNPSLDIDPDFDLDGFTAEGLLIARAVKAELPDWTIVYHDEALGNYTLWWRHHPRVCHYEIKAKLH